MNKEDRINTILEVMGKKQNPFFMNELIKKLGNSERQLKYFLKNPIENADFLHSVIEDLGEEFSNTPRELKQKVKLAYHQSGIPFNQLLDEFDLTKIEVQLEGVKHFSENLKPTNTLENPFGFFEWDDRLTEYEFETVLEVITDLLYMDFFERGLSEIEVKENTGFNEMFRKALEIKESFKPFTFSITKILRKYEFFNPIFKEFATYLLNPGIGVAESSFYRIWINNNVEGNKKTNAEIITEAINNFLIYECLGVTKEGIDFFGNLPKIEYSLGNLILNVVDTEKYLVIPIELMYNKESKPEMPNFSKTNQEFKGIIFITLIRSEVGSRVIVERITNQQETDNLLNGERLSLYRIPDRRKEFFYDMAINIANKSGDELK